jgi:molybdopterin converting factor small subunit
MTIRVKLFASLRQFGPDEQMMEMPENSNLSDVIARLKLPEKIPLLKVVNGEIRKTDYILGEGDEVALFPPIAGGQAGFRDPCPVRSL